MQSISVYYVFVDIYVIFFQNAIFLDEMGENESDKLKIKN